MKTRYFVIFSLTTLCSSLFAAAPHQSNPRSAQHRQANHSQLATVAVSTAVPSLHEQKMLLASLFMLQGNKEQVAFELASRITAEARIRANAEAERFGRSAPNHSGHNISVGFIAMATVPENLIQTRAQATLRALQAHAKK